MQPIAGAINILYKFEILHQQHFDGIINCNTPKQSASSIVTSASALDTVTAVPSSWASAAEFETALADPLLASATALDWETAVPCCVALAVETDLALEVPPDEEDVATALAVAEAVANSLRRRSSCDDEDLICGFLAWV